MKEGDMTQSEETNHVIRLRLTPAVEERLREKAKLADLSLETYLEELAQEDAAETSPSPLELAVKRLTSRTEEQILADRERILATARPGRPLPEGKTLEDVVAGTWPGDETDEEIHQMLEELS
jgi:hypothetical protein